MLLPKSAGFVYTQVSEILRLWIFWSCFVSSRAFFVTVKWHSNRSGFCKCTSFFWDTYHSICVHGCYIVDLVDPSRTLCSILRNCHRRQSCWSRRSNRSGLFHKTRRSVTVTGPRYDLALYNMHTAI